MHLGLPPGEKYVSSARVAHSNWIEWRGWRARGRERYVREDCLSVLLLMHMHVRGRDGGWKKEGMLHLAGVCYSQIGLEHVTCAMKLNLELG